MRPSRAVLAASLAVPAMLLGVAVIPGDASAFSPPHPAPPSPAPRHGLLTAGESTALTLAATPEVVATGRPASLAGRLIDPATGFGLSGAPVRVEAAAADGSWSEVAVLSTDAAGRVTAELAPTATTVYRLHYADAATTGDPGTTRESMSPAARVTVRTLTADLTDDAVRVGRPAEVRGVLAAAPGSPLRLEVHRDGAWQPVGRKRTAADGSYTFRVTPTEPGSSRYRVVRDVGPGGPESTAAVGVLDVYRLHTSSVATRGRVRGDLDVLRATLAETYADPQGWLRSHHRFREVARGGDFTVVLSQPEYLPAFSWECSTMYSCRAGRYVVLNDNRWRHGSPHFPADLETYRRMLVNHETGHWLGRGHAYCPHKGAPAPVMQQQSKGMQGCRPNPWPLPREIDAVP